VECPFCDNKMTVGEVFIANRYFATGTQVVFKPEGPDTYNWQVVLAPGLFRRRTRWAHLCTECGAVLIDPVDAET
jgi:hypothetical protein